MRMGVQNNVNSGGIGCYAQRRPVALHSLITQMGQGYHAVRSVGNGSIHRILYGCVQLLGRIRAEAVNIVSILILEIGGGGFGNRLRCGNAYISYPELLSAYVVCNHLVSVKYRLSALLIDKVAGKERGVGILRVVQESFHAVIKFMVARDADIIPDHGHQLYGILSIGLCAYHGSLDGISQINGCHLIGNGSDILFHCRQSRVSQAVG